MTDHSEDRVTVWMSSELIDEMDEHVDWRNSSRSEYVREAAQYRITLENSLERRNMDLPADPDERKAMIEDILIAGVATFATDN